MPYATYDRDAFIARTGLGPDMKVLSIGPDHALALQIAKYVENTVTVVLFHPQHARGIRALVPGLNIIIAHHAHQPFKASTFDIVFSYHTLNCIPADEMVKMCNETKRLLKERCRFTSRLWSLKPANKAQSSHLMLLNILEQIGIVHLHRFDAVSRWLEEAGFENITMELINSQITVPDGWVCSHIRMLDEIIEEYIHNKRSILMNIEKDVELYKEYVQKNGEELMPAIQFTAKYSKDLYEIDIIK
jgi:ubiquinone/menaquinone biosynthesis C-methylase UbiE